MARRQTFGIVVHLQAEAKVGQGDLGPAHKNVRWLAVTMGIAVRMNGGKSLRHLYQQCDSVRRSLAKFRVLDIVFQRFVVPRHVKRPGSPTNRLWLGSGR